MKKLIGILIIILGTIGGLYIGAWLMFIQPIIELCKNFDSGTVTGIIVGTTVLKCVFASSVGSIIVYVCNVIGTVVALD